MPSLLRLEIFHKQTSLNLVIFGKNKGSFREKKMFQLMLNPSLLIDVCLVKAMVFPVVMYGCESWTVKKAERRRIDAFELWCWRRLLRVP